jgi:hypothetical protein
MKLERKKDEPKKDLFSFSCLVHLPFYFSFFVKLEKTFVEPADDRSPGSFGAKYFLDIRLRFFGRFWGRQRVSGLDAPEGTAWFS